jgi:hypothetical protein
MRVTLFAVSLLLTGHGTAMAASLSIEQLEQTCNSQDAQAACAAYLMGMVHGLQLVDQI